MECLHNASLSAYFQWPYHCFPGISVVALPSPHHRWSVSNSSVAQVDSMMGLTNAGHIQVSSLSVVVPDNLRLYIAPFSASGDPHEEAEVIPPVARWYVVSGRQYLIQMKVFSRGPGAQEIYITKVSHASSSFTSLILCMKVTTYMSSL